MFRLLKKETPCGDIKSCFGCLKETTHRNYVWIENTEKNNLYISFND